MNLLMLKNFLLLSLFFSPIATIAQLKVAAVFNDHMVLQRHMPIPIWGTAAAGSELVIRFNGETVKATSDYNGHWKVKLAAMNAGGPYQMDISSGDASMMFTDILIGEVWLCSGQSNMEWPLKNTIKGAVELTQAQHSNIRLFHLKKKHNTYKTPYTEEELVSFSEKDFFNQAKWELCNEETAAEFSGVGYFFGKALHDSLNIPIGLIQAAVGGSPAQSWISQNAMASHPQLQSLVSFPPHKNWLDSEIIHPWLAERAQENWANWQQIDNEALPGHPFAPSYLYASAIKPLAPYAIRGVIWYQGESNATHPDSYLPLMESLLRDWRNLWGQGGFPFYFVQLPKIGNRSLWPEFREAQAKCLSLPNTGMIITIDQGHPTDVHPRQKEVIGQRLSRLALSQTYGFNIQALSPSLSSYQWNQETHSIVLHFANTYGGLALKEGQIPKGFSLQGFLQQGTLEAIILAEDIKITEETITISYSSDFLPTIIKYAWAPYPTNNLTNSAGLPLAPFKIELNGTN